MKTIYLVYAVREEGNRVVTAVFSQEETAKKYCKEWNDDLTTYFIVEEKLDEYAHWYK